MVEIEFLYKQQEKIIIQANLNDSFESVLTKLQTKISTNLNDVCFLSNGRSINKTDIINDILSKTEKQNRKIKIMITDIKGEIDGNENIINSEDIICPECQELCRYEIKNYNIKLYDCKNGHERKNIRLNEYMNTQNIDLSKIICDKCQNNDKSTSYDNKFFICGECKMNLCPICKSNHDKSHLIINYDSKNYICYKHNENYVKYCENCKKDLCFCCLQEHNEHDIVNYEDELVNIKDILKSMNKLRITIDKYKQNLKELITKINKVIEYVDIYYDINKKILDNYQKGKKRNYNLILNLKELQNSINEQIEIISGDQDYGHNLNSILYTYNEMINKNKSIEINYRPDKNNTEKVKLF